MTNHLPFRCGHYRHYWWICAIEFCMFQVHRQIPLYIYEYICMCTYLADIIRASICPFGHWSIRSLCSVQIDYLWVRSSFDRGKHSRVEPITYSVEHTINNLFWCQLPWAGQCIICEFLDGDDPRVEWMITSLWWVSNCVYIVYMQAQEVIHRFHKLNSLQWVRQVLILSVTDQLYHWSKENIYNFYSYLQFAIYSELRLLFML